MSYSTIQGTSESQSYVSHFVSYYDSSIRFHDNDTVYAGDGNDTLINDHYDGKNSVLYGGTGNDYIMSSTVCKMYGEEDNDTLVLAADNIFAHGGDGDDSIIIKPAKNSIIYGGKGSDTISIQPQDKKITATIMDLNNSDTLFIDDSSKKFTYEITDGSMIFSDDDKNFELTFDGVTNPAQVANVKVEYFMGNMSSTLGKLLGISTEKNTSTVPVAEEQTIFIPNTEDDEPTDTDSSFNVNVNGDNNSVNVIVNNNTTVNNTTNNNFFDFPVANRETKTTETKTTPTTTSTTKTTTPTTTNTTTTNAFSNIGTKFSFSGGMNRIIQNFVTGTKSNSNVLAFGTSLSSIRRTSSAMYFNATDGTSLQVNNSSSVNEAIQYSTDGKTISLAKVGYAEQSNTFTYEDGVNFYSGGNYTDVLKVTNYQGSNVWLDGSAGVGYDKINNIDASTSTGNNTLAGNAGNNQITAGSGNNSLWGGAGSSEDVLIGGSGGNDTFFYGKNYGNDKIQNSKQSERQCNFSNF